jgi:hypothetical protein
MFGAPNLRGFVIKCNGPMLFFLLTTPLRIALRK